MRSTPWVRRARPQSRILLPLLEEGADYFDHNPVLNINHVAEALAG